MTINLSPADEARLATHARECGYNSVEAYVSDHVLALATQPTREEQPQWTEAELREFAEMCDRGMEDVKEGRTLTLEQARLRARLVRSPDAQ